MKTHHPIDRILSPKEEFGCAHCTEFENSLCCNALIINHDICSDCGEHTESMCHECEYEIHPDLK